MASPSSPDVLSWALKIADKVTISLEAVDRPRPQKYERIDHDGWARRATGPTTLNERRVSR
jgi:hypothetical protein